MPGKTNGVGDAVRHCVGIGETARRTNSHFAKAAGHYHEFKGKNPKAEKKMDLHNNRVGANIGKKAKSYNDVHKKCIQAAKDGRLQLSNTKVHPKNKY